jgi:hypothetical protein
MQYERFNFHRRAYMKIWNDTNQSVSVIETPTALPIFLLATPRTGSGCIHHTIQEGVP